MGLLKKTRSRLSLNLGVFDGSLSPGSPSKSPRFIPKFLRSSFSKLRIRDKSCTPEQSQEPLSLPFISKWTTSAQNSPRVEESQNYGSKCSTDEDELSPPSTPTTKLFVEESLAKGLPIIPFNYPTFVIVEKKRAQSKNSNNSCKPVDENMNTTIDIEVEEPKTYSYSAPASRKVSKQNTDQISCDFLLEEKSLKKLLGVAKQEMEQEASVKKKSWIRGYASNNSRALLRRRSSVSEYVEMSVDTTKDITKPSYAISENSARKDSLRNCSFAKGKHGLLKLSKPKHVITSTTMHSSDLRNAPEERDYMDMTCGKKQS